MSKNEKIIFTALCGAVGAYVGRRWTWKCFTPIYRAVGLNGCADWAENCPMWQAVAVGAVAGAVCETASQIIQESIEDVLAQTTRHPDGIEIIRWPDGTWELAEDFNWERDYSHMSDDYEVVEITEEEYQALVS